MRIILAVSALMAAGLATPAMAREDVGYQDIAAGNLSAAEQTLATQQALRPDQPEVMLNLAAIYARTGRDAQARSMYAATLVAPAVDMDLANGAVVSSHVLARSGLTRLAASHVAAR